MLWFEVEPERLRQSNETIKQDLVRNVIRATLCIVHAGMAHKSQTDISDQDIRGTHLDSRCSNPDVDCLYRINGLPGMCSDFEAVY